VRRQVAFVIKPSSRFATRSISARSTTAAASVPDRSLRASFVAPPPFPGLFSLVFFEPRASFEATSRSTVAGLTPNAFAIPASGPEGTAMTITHEVSGGGRAKLAISRSGKSLMELLKRLKLDGFRCSPTSTACSRHMA
jgi:hypothetical protein